MSYAKGKNFNVVFLPLRYSAGDAYRGSGLVLTGLKYTLSRKVFHDSGVKKLIMGRSSVGKMDE